MNYDCTICGRQYRYEESLYLHMKTDHGLGGIESALQKDNSSDSALMAGNPNDSALMAGNASDHVAIDIDVGGGSSSVDQLIIADAVKDVIDNGTDSETIKTSIA